MNGLIGRVADAILEDLLDRRGIRQELEQIKYGDPEIWKDIREAIGRNAIAAMREPTDDMVEVGRGEPEGTIEASGMRRAWHAMIDAALNPTGKSPT